MLDNKSPRAWRPNFWSWPPTWGLVFWVGIGLVVLLHNWFWPTVVMLLAIGAYLYWKRANEKQPLSPPGLRRRVYRRRS